MTIRFARRFLLSLTLSSLGGCAALRPSTLQRAIGQDLSQLSLDVRMCGWGNHAACEDLRHRLEPLALDPARADALAGEVERASHEDLGELSQSLSSCRNGDGRACDDLAVQLADEVTTLQPGAAPTTATAIAR